MFHDKYIFVKIVPMLISATLSKPVNNIEELTGFAYKRIKIKISSASSKDTVYFAEFFTEKQVFHKKMTAAEVQEFLDKNTGITFKNAVEFTEDEQITVLTNKKGKITRLVKKLNNALPAAVSRPQDGTDEDYAQRRDGSLLPERPDNDNHIKNYILQEGRPVPFLVRLGIMTAQGKVIGAKYHKFRQINRFLEILSDVVKKMPKNKELNIVDFGSGKSYLTFAVQYYMNEIAHIKANIFGLDLKKDVIEYCSRLADELNLSNLEFAVGDIASFGEDKKPDIIITLHACDTATDYALDYAVKHGAKAILSVPCCQHEINLQLKKTSDETSSEFAPLLKYGLIKEKFSALVTDALRGQILENEGYSVQMLEFIDESDTPKNLMIKAVKNSSSETTKKRPDLPLLEALKVKQTLYKLMYEQKLNYF